MEHLPALCGALEEQQVLFDTYYTRLRATLDQAQARRARPEAAAAAAATAAAAAAKVAAGAGAVPGAAGAAAGGVGGAGLGLADMMANAQRLASGQDSKRCLEDLGETRVMRLPLIPSKELRVWDGGGGAPFLALLPGFAPTSPAQGNNALFVRGEFYDVRGYDRLYGAVNLLGDRTGGDGGSTVLAHTCFRVDPTRGTDGAALKRTYVQGYKLGFWQTTARLIVSEAASPVRSGVPFWWRVVVHPNGFATYVDGALQQVSLPPPGQELRQGQELYVSLPVSGDGGERATWRVTQLWWGSLPLDADPAAVRELAKLAGGQGARGVVGNQVRATGVPEGTTEGELAEAAAAGTGYAPTGVRMGAAGSAVLTFPSDEQVRRILAGAGMRVAVRGVPLTLSQVIEGGGGGGGGRGGAPGGR